MVSITKKRIRGKIYYYLEYSFRDGSKTKNIVKYLGTKIPSNIDWIKNEFLIKIYDEKWHSLLRKIKENYNKESKSLPKSSREKRIENFAVKFTYDTQRIEGSTLTLHETADLLERGTTPKNKSLRDVKETEAHRDLFDKIIGLDKDLSLQMILDWHYELFKSTKPDIAGKIRKHQVYIARSKFVPPSPVELQPMLVEFFEWYKRNKDKLNPVELAALVHLKFVTIHPFPDGNGRISRLMMNFVLNKKGYPMLNILYKDRNSYYNSLERSQVKKLDNIFLQWFFRKYVKEYKKFSSK